MAHSPDSVHGLSTDDLVARARAVAAGLLPEDPLALYEALARRLELTAAQCDRQKLVVLGARAALAAVEWAEHGPEGHFRCPACGGFRPADIKANDRPYYKDRAGHHTAVCVLAALVAQLAELGPEVR